MFSFGKQSYVQIDHDRPHANGGSRGGGDSWARAEGDVELSDAERGAATNGISSSSTPRFAPAAGSGGGGSMGADSGRVQVPIGMVADSKSMRTMQMVMLLVFSAVNIAMFIMFFWLGLYLHGIGRVFIVLVGGGGWLALMLFNVRMASRPRKVIQTFLQSKPKTKLGRKLGKGQVVVLKGAVSLLHEELLSTEFHNVPGLVLVESSLRSYHPGVRKADAWSEHVRQTRAVDFRVTDAQTGMSAIVKAFNAAETGVASPLVHISTEVPLSTAAPVAPPVAPMMSESAMPRPVETAEAKKRRAASNPPQLMVCKGYIRQGQVITVMGTLHEDAATHELLIQPLPQPRNISKFLLFRGFIPFFFPIWASGLIISDQRDLS